MGVENAQGQLREAGQVPVGEKPGVVCVPGAEVQAQKEREREIQIRQVCRLLGGINVVAHCIGNNHPVSAVLCVGWNA